MVEVHAIYFSPPQRASGPASEQWSWGGRQPCPGHRRRLSTPREHHGQRHEEHDPSGIKSEFLIATSSESTWGDHQGGEGRDRGDRFPHKNLSINIDYYDS